MIVEILNRAVGKKAVFAGIIAIVWIYWFVCKHANDDISDATFWFIVLSVAGIFFTLIWLLFVSRAVRSTKSLNHYFLCIGAGIAAIALGIAMPMPFGVLDLFGFILIVYGLGGYFGFNRRRPGA
jgi:hypothetical protein